MKSLTLIAMMFATTAMAATDGIRKVDVHLDTVVEVSQEQSSAISARVAYPGLAISAVCSLQLQLVGDTETEIAPLLDAIDVKGIYDESAIPRATLRDATTIDISLLLETYVDAVSISTKDGSSLANAVQRALGKGKKVVLTAKGC
jgi:hypothetical protein